MLSPPPRVRHAAAWMASLLAPLLLAATLVSLVPSDRWWIRALGFPRFALLLATVPLAMAALAARNRWRAGLLAMLAAVAGLQAWYLHPYGPLASEEVAAPRPGIAPGDPACFTVLGLNVLQENRDHARTRVLIERERPDILLLMETDRRWVEALAPALAPYPTKLLRPIGNTYGLVFATRLPTMAASTENVTDRRTPTVYARLATRGGAAFDYVGLHPRPPLPGQDTDRRDEKIERAALRVAGHRVPALAMGDFNDVAWSRTTRLFKRVGGYLDPRIGRGAFATFPASATAVGWPLDQLFVSRSFTLRSLRVLEAVGSDHRPLAAELCLAPDPVGRNAPLAPVTSAARAAARRMAGE